MSDDWPGVLDPDVLNEELVEHSHHLADAARAGRWDTLLDLVEEDGARGVNQWRIGGTSWFTPLHQAAWLGAPVDVVERLLRAGAWRSLRTAEGDRPIDLARTRGHLHLLEALAVRDPSGSPIPGCTEASASHCTGTGSRGELEPRGGRLGPGPRHHRERQRTRRGGPRLIGPGHGPLGRAHRSTSMHRPYSWDTSSSISATRARACSSSARRR